MTVSLFIPCLTDQFYPQTGMNMVEVLERVGVNVTYDPSQTCCGQPAFNTGYHHEARILAKRFIEIFENAEYIVAPSGSCATMAKIFYGDLLSLPEPYQKKAEKIRTRLFEFTSFLVDVLKIDDVGATFRGSVTLHDSCHALRELRIKDQPRRLLGKVKGLELVEMKNSEVCCGFGGTFAVKFANISAEMDKAKTEEIIKSGVDVVTAVDSSCLMHIDGMLRRTQCPIRAIHIADILASTD